MNLVLIGGESAVGKTTIMRKIIPHLGNGTFIKYKLFRGTYYPLTRVLLAGIYDGDLFDGSDRLSRICQMDTCDFLSKLDKDLPGTLFLAEGDNYFRKDFITGIQRAGFQYCYAFITQNEVTREKRQIERLRHQTAKTLKARVTKYNRLIKELNPNIILNNDTTFDLHRNVSFIRDMIESHSKMKSDSALQSQLPTHDVTHTVLE